MARAPWRAGGCPRSPGSAAGPAGHRRQHESRDLPAYRSRGLSTAPSGIEGDPWPRGPFQVRDSPKRAEAVGKVGERGGDGTELVELQRGSRGAWGRRGTHQKTISVLLSNTKVRSTR